MLSDEASKNKFGRLKGPPINASILTVVAFVEKYLVEFSYRYTGSTITNEKGLTQELCILLNFYVRKEAYPFWFEKEYMEETGRGNSPQVDIGVISSQTGGITIDSKCYSNKETFFSMEAKRLCNLSKAREKEYLVGRIEKGRYIECGGIERFKNEIHGRGLKYGAVIGYVQEYDFSYWLNTVNSWIDDLVDGTIATSTIWSGKDKLSGEYIRPSTAKFKSEHLRKTGSIIFLFHLWVNLVKKKDFL